MASKFSSPLSSSLSSSVPVVPTNQLTINDLNWVLLLLTRHGYSGVTYRNLGLHLGLSRRRLDVITSKNRGDTDSGLRECLNVWLEKPDNRTDDVPKTNIYSLVSALRKLGENGVADRIDMEIHPACRILAHYSSNQSLLSALPQLVIYLYKAELIKEAILPHYIQGEALMGDIKATVCHDNKKFEAFTDILCKDITTAEIGRAIQRDYREAYWSDDDDENVGGFKIYLAKSVTTELYLMRLKFGQTFIKVESIMKNNPHSRASIDYIKHVLGLYNSTLRPQLVQCKDISDILQLIRDNGSLDDNDISMLEYFVKKFNVEEAKPVIKEYKGAIEKLKMKFCQFLIGELLKASSLLKYVTIVVDKDTEESVLKDVQRFSSVVLPYHIKLIVIRGDGGGCWEVWKQESFTDTYVGPTVQSKDATLTTEVPAEITEKDEDKAMLLLEKVPNIQKQLEEEKELHEKEKQFHEQVAKEYEERIATLTQQQEEITGDLKHKTEQYEELISENELTHKQLEELQKELKQEKIEKGEIQIKINDLQQELEQVSVQSDYTITQLELQYELQKIKNESETFQKQRKALILENERLMSLIKDQNIPVQQKEETEILQETETVHTCTYISKG